MRVTRYGWVDAQDIDETFRQIARSQHMKLDAEQRVADRTALPCARCRVHDRVPRSPYCPECDWTAPIR